MFVCVRAHVSRHSLLPQLLQLLQHVALAALRVVAADVGRAAAVRHRPQVVQGVGVLGAPRASVPQPPPLCHVRRRHREPAVGRCAHQAQAACPLAASPPRACCCRCHPGTLLHLCVPLFIVVFSVGFGALLCPSVAVLRGGLEGSVRAGLRRGTWWARCPGWSPSHPAPLCCSLTRWNYRPPPPTATAGGLAPPVTIEGLVTPGAAGGLAPPGTVGGLVPPGTAGGLAPPATVGGLAATVTTGISMLGVTWKRPTVTTGAGWCSARSETREETMRKWELGHWSYNSSFLLYRLLISAPWGDNRKRLIPTLPGGWSCCKSPLVLTLVPIVTSYKGVGGIYIYIYVWTCTVSEWVFVHTGQSLAEQ